VETVEGALFQLRVDAMGMFRVRRHALLERYPAGVYFAHTKTRRPCPSMLVH
jgi:hypothetical protein